MSKKHKKIEKKTRPKTGFERLVEHKEKAKLKAQLRIQQSVVQTIDRSTSKKKIIDKENVRQLFSRKHNKKSIFEIESDDDMVEHNPFVQEVGLFCEEEPPIETKNESQRKNRREIFYEIMTKSKRGRLEKTKEIEELKECIEELNDDYEKIKSKLNFSDKKAIKQTRFENDKSNYLKILDQMKDEELLRPSKKPKIDKPETSSSNDDGDEKDWRGANDYNKNEASDSEDDNVEIGDIEEKEMKNPKWNNDRRRK